jgi:hypothetical protein
MSIVSAAMAETGIIIRARRLRGALSSAGGGGSYTAALVVLGVIAALLVISYLVRRVCTKKQLRLRTRRDRVACYDDGSEGGLPRWRLRR